MQKYQDSMLIMNTLGQFIPGTGITVKVYQAGTGTLASIYSDNGATPIDQVATPITTDANGAFFFYAANGHYDIQFSGTGITAFLRTDVLLADIGTTLSNNYADQLVGSTVDAIQASYPAAALQDGYPFIVNTIGGNTITNPTFQPTVAGVLQTAHTIKKHDASGALIALAAGDTVGFAHLRWDAVNAVYILENPATDAVRTYGNQVIAGNKQFTTPPQFDNSQLVPTTAFIQRALGNLSGINSYTANASLNATNTGKLNLFTGSTAAQTLTLPAANSVAAGSSVVFVNQASVPVTISRAGADTLNIANPYGAAVNLTSVSLSKGDSVIFVSDGVSTWQNILSPTSYKYSASLAVGSNSYQRLPSGFIIQFGSSATTVGGTVGVTFATAFPTGIIMVVASVTQNTLQICEISAKSTTGFTANTYVTSTGASGNCAFDWIAIGF